ncbi:lamin-like protein [Panicum miliaceum]|uniref:Lamin-like protein n=1 Tax=Panicum miliaceum TaxID=4540 RepID=A0A3L6QTJ5_PANMI|nr:lamin-like protein [Panicum miliaceum]
MQPCSITFQRVEWMAPPPYGGQSGWPLGPWEAGSQPWRVNDSVPAKSAETPWCPDKISGPQFTAKRTEAQRSNLLFLLVALMLRSPTAAMSWLLVVAVLAGFTVDLSAATDHIVGANHGWNPNINYSLWSSNQTFYVGDLICKSSSLAEQNVDPLRLHSRPSVPMTRRGCAAFRGSTGAQGEASEAALRTRSAVWLAAIAVGAAAIGAFC